MKKGNIFLSPYFVMGIVLVMYFIKVVAKISVGTHVHSPVITGDGYHNIADIFEAVFVIVVILYARMPHGDEYPFGRKNVESIFSLVVGFLLCITAFRLGVQCLIGFIECVPRLSALVHLFVSPPQTELLLMGSTYFPLVAGVTGISALLSLVVGRYQMYVGRRVSHESLIADGAETLSDGRIEIVAFVGILGEYLFRTPIIEYPLGIFVAYLVLRTGREIGIKGWNALLQKSIGKNHEERILKSVEDIPGVIGLAQLKTFYVGERVVCIMKVITRCAEETNIDIKHVIAHHIIAYLKEQELEDGEFFIRFDRPTPNRFRVAYGIEREGDRVVVSRTLLSATHLRICDIEDEDVVRWKDEPLPKENTIRAIIEFLVRKRVITFFACGDEPHVEDLKSVGIAFHKTLSPSPKMAGIY